MRDLTEPRGGIYKHYKGGRYRLLYVARHHETGEKFVVYMALDSGHDGSINIRPLDTPGQDSWLDGIDGPNGEIMQRFRYLRP